ncbi:hypothetical protein HZ994_02395 [Akkermansiaceae bacterium]|nr:hypothetical protein HZ994_02395 [Akkermansiaceae bacterium]
MNDITQDLKCYKEFEALWEQSVVREIHEYVGKSVEGYPLENDPRVSRFREARERLCKLALQADAVVITDHTLHQLFEKIRNEAIKYEFGENGEIESIDLFEDLADKYHPEHYAKCFAITKPLITLNNVPGEVVALVKETREAYCLRLPTACISLSRSLVERVIVDIAIRSGRLSEENRLSEMGMCDRISLLLDKSVSSTSPLRREINAFMRAASNVIHSNTVADMPSALELFREALRLTQALYGQYKNQFKK